jgi:predicted thioesterase
VDVKHLAPTPVGATVTARAVLTRVDKRTLTFAVDARDERERVAEGTHTRVIVDAARFAKKAADKLAAQ